MSRTELTVYSHSRETTGAVLLSKDGDPQEAVWLPKSQIKIINRDDDNALMIIDAPDWLLKKEGFI